MSAARILISVDDQQTARVLRIAWGQHEPRTRGPRPELTHDQIVDTAIAIADDQGITAVTMARVGEKLGFSAMSLYRYVSSKDELLALMTDRAGLIPRTVTDGADGWRDGLTAVAQHGMKMYRAHPWLLDVPTSMISLFLPGGVEAADTVLRALREVPISRDEKLGMLLTMTVTLRAYASLARDITAQTTIFTAETGEFLAQVVTEDRFPDLAPIMAGGMYAEPDEAQDLDEELGYALERFFDGIEARIAESVSEGTQSATEGTQSAGEGTQ